MGYVVKAKAGELEKITRDGRITRMKKEMEVCVQDVLGKNNFLVQFKDGQRKEISSPFLTFSSSKD